MTRKSGRRKRAARFQSALKAVNRRHRKTLSALATADVQQEVKGLILQDEVLLKRLAKS